MEHGKGMYYGVQKAGLTVLGLDENGKPKKKPAEQPHPINGECPYLEPPNAKRSSTRR